MGLLDFLGLGGRPIEELAKLLGMGSKIDRLERFPQDYVPFTIPKRRGGRRTIHAPSPELKSLQRTILHKVLVRMPIHAAATAYAAGRSIVDNARPHVGAELVVTMDLEDFFGSTRADRIEPFFRRAGWSKRAAAALLRLVTLNGALPQGAPTSPKLSNLVNYKLDVRLDRYTRAAGGRYTRYSDDLTFSFPKEPRKLHAFRRRVREILRDEGYEIQKDKRVQIRRPHQPQMVTGLVVNAKVSVPRAVRRRLRAMEHHLRVGRPINVAPKQIEGLRAYVAMVSGRCGGQAGGSR